MRWTDPDACWRCGGGRQSREHLFKECREWKREIHVLWQKVGDLSGERKEGSRNPLESRKGFEYSKRKACARASNRTVRGLPGNEMFTEAVLEFGEYRRGDNQGGMILDKG